MDDLSVSEEVLNETRRGSKVCRSLAEGQDAPSAKAIKKSNPNHSFASSGGSVFGYFWGATILPGTKLDCLWLPVG